MSEKLKDPVKRPSSKPFSKADLEEKFQDVVRSFGGKTKRLEIELNMYLDDTRTVSAGNLQNMINEFRKLRESFMRQCRAIVGDNLQAELLLRTLPKFAKVCAFFLRTQLYLLLLQNIYIPLSQAERSKPDNRVCDKSEYQCKRLLNNMPETVEELSPNNLLIFLGNLSIGRLAINILRFRSRIEQIPDKQIPDMKIIERILTKLEGHLLFPWRGGTVYLDMTKKYSLKALHNILEKKVAGLEAHVVGDFENLRKVADSLQKDMTPAEFLRFTMETLESAKQTAVRKIYQEASELLRKYERIEGLKSSEPDTAAPEKDEDYQKLINHCQGALAKEFEENLKLNHLVEVSPSRPVKRLLINYSEKMEQTVSERNPETGKMEMIKMKNFPEMRIQCQLDMISEIKPVIDRMENMELADLSLLQKLLDIEDCRAVTQIKDLTEDEIQQLITLDKRLKREEANQTVEVHRKLFSEQFENFQDHVLSWIKE